MMQHQTLKKLDDLLDSALADTIPELSGYTEQVEAVLADNERLKASKLQTIEDVPNIGKHLQQKVLDIETLLANQLPPEKLTEKGSLANVIKESFAYLNDINDEGYFVKESVFEDILEEHPPVNLMSLEEGVLGTLSTLQRVSLTRHTESREWQDTYLEKLSELKPSDFEVRRVNFVVFDTPEVIGLMDASSMKQKPWRMSHCKETGYVNVFTQDNESIKTGTPILQFFLVLFHYYYECLFSSGVSYMHKNSNEIGTKLKGIIGSGKDKYDFFHPNCYSEHVYWMHGFSSLQSYLSDIDFSLFSDSMTCGGYVDPKLPNSELVSFNIVDQVWNLNHVGDKDYFEFSSVSFFYHFREGLWYDIMAKVSGQTPESMEKFILSNLSSGDQTLTKMLLE
jgi:hypothetical protein